MFKKLIQTLCFVALVCAATRHAEAANPQAIDTVTWVGNELNNMVSANIGVFVAEGQNVIGSIFGCFLFGTCSSGYCRSRSVMNCWWNSF